MKKKVLFVLAIILVAVLCVSVWYYGYYNRKSNDNIPSKELIVSYYQNKGADYDSNGVVEYVKIMNKELTNSACRTGKIVIEGSK